MYHEFPKAKANRLDREIYNEIQFLYYLEDHDKSLKSIQSKKNKWLPRNIWESDYNEFKEKYSVIFKIWVQICLNEVKKKTNYESSIKEKLRQFHLFHASNFTIHKFFKIIEYVFLLHKSCIYNLMTTFERVI